MIMLTTIAMLAYVRATASTRPIYNHWYNFCRDCATHFQASQRVWPMTVRANTLLSGVTMEKSPCIHLQQRKNTCHSVFCEYNALTVSSLFLAGKKMKIVCCPGHDSKSVGLMSFFHTGKPGQVTTTLIVWANHS